MNQSELVSKLRRRLEENASIAISKAETAEVFKTVVGLVADLLVDGHDVSLPGLGKLSTRIVPTRVVISPLSGKSTEVAAHRRVLFSTSSKLKKELR